MMALNMDIWKLIISLNIHGTGIYLPTLMVDVYGGFHVGKYTIVPWIHHGYVESYFLGHDLRL